MTDPLHDAIDQAGRDLLTRCGAVGDDGKTVSVTQQVEAFAAVAKWAEIRHKMAPPPPSETKDRESKFERTKREFHGGRKPGRPPANGAAASDGAAPSEASAAPADSGTPAADAAITEH